MMLKCKVCGGELEFSNEKYTCLSCGASFSLTQIYENLEVCLCNIESEENGGRTVASHLAAEIYTLLEANKIKTYYSRVSSADLFGEDLERAYISAISSSRIIVLVGTKPAEFEALSSKYKPLFEGKIVVPVFKDMDAKNLPKNISATQGIDYSRIGASADLTKGILNALGRGDEYNYVVASAKGRKSKRIWLVLVIIALIVVIVAVAVIINIASKGGNTEQETTTTSQTERSQEDIYLSAKALADEKKYADAITEFSKIVGYKDSQKQINLLKQKYAGYYTDDNSNIDFHLKITNTGTANIVLNYTQNNLVCEIESVLLLNGTTCSFEFADSENNEGTVSVLLTNDGVEVQIKTNEKNSDIFFPDSNLVFSLGEKSDAPVREITLDWIISLVENKTLLSDLRRMGVELITEGDDGEPGDYYGTHHQIANTDIIIITYNVDVLDLDNWSSSTVEEYVVAVIAPADIVSPEKIGSQGLAFSEDGIIYAPNAYGCYINNQYIWGEIFVAFGCDAGNIRKDSPIGIVSEAIIGETSSRLMLEHNEYSYYQTIFNEYFSSMGYNPYIYEFEIVAKNDTDILACACERSYTYNYECVRDYYFKINRTTLEVEYITALVNSYDGDPVHVKWKNYPYLFKEFIPDYVEPMYREVEGTIIVTTEGHFIYAEPSHDSEIVAELPTGLSDVVLEYIDDEDNIWCKLKDEDGWINLTSISETTDWGSE